MTRTVLRAAVVSCLLGGLVGQAAGREHRGGSRRPGGSAMIADRLRGCIEVMPTCRECNDEVDRLVSVKVGGKAKKLCEDCADRAREEGELAEASEGVVQSMMGFKGRR